MKVLPILSILLFAAITLPAYGQLGKRGPRPGRPGITKEEIGKHAAMREEQLLDQIDTHKWKKDPEATDKRPSGLTEYHTRTLRRIVALLRHGALSEEKGKFFKEEHTSITLQGKEFNKDGELSAEERETLRGRLDKLNDDINAAIEEAEKGDERTPLFNQTQHRFEEKIEFGVRSGRLSKGEAATLTRKVESLKRLEEREKSGGLSSREREKLFEQAAEVERDINKALKD